MGEAPSQQGRALHPKTRPWLNPCVCACVRVSPLAPGKPQVNQERTCRRKSRQVLDWAWARGLGWGRPQLSGDRSCRRQDLGQPLCVWVRACVSPWPGGGPRSTGKGLAGDKPLTGSGQVWVGGGPNSAGKGLAKDKPLTWWVHLAWGMPQVRGGALKVSTVPHRQPRRL